MTLSLDHPLPYEVLLALDGEVCPERTKSILDHLCKCPQCRTLVGEVESMLSMFAETLALLGDDALTAAEVPTFYDDRFLAPGRRSRSQSEDAQLQTSKPKLNRRLREFYQHRPHVLLVVVNGRPVADLAIVHKTNRWTLEVGSRVEYIEVVSEQGICLLAMYVEDFPMSGFTELKQTTRLSDGRNLHLALSQTISVARLSVRYQDSGQAPRVRRVA